MKEFFFKFAIALMAFTLGIGAVIVASSFSYLETCPSDDAEVKQYSVLQVSEKSLGVKQSDFRQNLPMLQMTELRINDIGLGASSQDIIWKLGKPSKGKKAGSFPCSFTQMLTLNYPGLEIKFDLDEEEKKFSAASIEVTSPKWTVLGIRIGANKADVLAKLSNYKYSTHIQDGEDSIGFANTDGYISFDFKGEKLVRIYWEYNFC